jgi:hypothetical protein
MKDKIEYSQHPANKWRKSTISGGTEIKKNTVPNDSNKNHYVKYVTKKII